MKKSIFLTIPLLLAAAILFGGPQLARAIDPADAVKYRQDVMDDLKDAMKRLRAAVQSANTEETKIAAGKIHKLSQDLPKLFPSGSLTEDSSASPDIWTNAADFETMIKDAEAKAEALVKASDSGNMADVESAMKDMGGVCKSCHKDFRSEK